MTTYNPFADPEALIEDGLKVKDAIIKPSPASSDSRGSDKPPRDEPGRQMLNLPNGNYAFNSIPYQGRIVPALELITQPLDNGANKTQAQWVEWAGQHPNEGTPVDSEILYQCLLRAYTLREDAKHKPVVQDFATVMQGLFDPNKPYFNTLTKVAYVAKSLDAVVSRLGSFPGNTKSSPVVVPQFTIYASDKNWSYLVLSLERSEAELAKTNAVPSNAVPVLKEILGEGCEHAGAVFPYFSTRKNGSVRESRFWTPAKSNRAIGERVVALGLDGGDDDWFVIGAGGYVGPALGVRPVGAEIFHSK